MRHTIISLAVASLGFAASVQAASINIDFNNGGATNQSPAITDVVGPSPTAGWYNQFNVGAAPGPMSLVDNNNNPVVGATFGFTQGGNALNGNAIYNTGYGARGTANASLTPNQQLFNGAANAARGGYNQEVKLTNIPYASFDVYLLVRAPVGNQGYGDAGYFDVTSLQMFSGASAGTTYFLASTKVDLPSNFTYIPATSTSYAAPTMEANYVLFSGLTGGPGTSYSFDLNSPLDSNGNALWFSNDGVISGVQIVEAVPEPASLGLLALAGLGLSARRRQHA